MRRVPWWAVLSSVLAPLLLIGGWTLAASLQPPEFSSFRDSISSLAAVAATDRWVMTAALAGVGACHLVTALGLRPAARTGRAILGLGGVATLLVAAFPVPEAGTSTPHLVAATISFGALAVWPALAWRRGPDTAGDLQPVPAVLATLVLLGLAGWFAVEVATNGTQLGLAERLAAGAEALWPLLVVLSVRTDEPAAQPATESPQPTA